MSGYEHISGTVYHLPPSHGVPSVSGDSCYVCNRGIEVDDSVVAVGSRYFNRWGGIVHSECVSGLCESLEETWEYSGHLLGEVV